ncbi:hypothetical protein C2G38_2226289 [Gigaspora rosea]|uniref:Uncharacterized protein n=1 Tax=Gigaspora rosea TaxID=44941 RepID=A0A397U014_9GLOM|nr:hypothetical protein C2G38_2226289 [Gigaspora rosea]
MSAITTKFVTDHKLTNEMSLEELSQYAPEILKLLTDDKEKRRQACNRLLNGYKFSKEQVFALIPFQRVGRCKSQAPVPKGSGLEAEEETIKETAQRIVQDKLSERDLKAISRTLIETASDSIVALSRLSRLQKELRTLNAPEKIISATFNPEALADVIIMLCIRPAEIKNLRISNGGVNGSLEKNEKRARELLTWIQEAISSGQLRDPGKIGSTYLSTFLKKDEFILETKSRKPLLPSSLRKLGSVFASIVHSPKNLSKANTYASEALRHSPDNHASLSKRYTIVNMRKRGEPYNQVEAFKLFDEN